MNTKIIAENEINFLPYEYVVVDISGEVKSFKKKPKFSESFGSWNIEAGGVIIDYGELLCFLPEKDMSNIDSKEFIYNPEEELYHVAEFT